MKYKLFRSPGNLDKAVRKHELVAVETGKNIDDVAEALIRDVRVRRYRYEMMGIVYPKYAEENVLIDYGIIEEEEA